MEDTWLEDSTASRILDGQANTQWYQKDNATMPVDLVIDLGKTEKLNGFRYRLTRTGGPAE